MPETDNVDDILASLVGMLTQLRRALQKRPRMVAARLNEWIEEYYEQRDEYDYSQEAKRLAFIAGVLQSVQSALEMEVD